MHIIRFSKRQAREPPPPAHSAPPTFSMRFTNLTRHTEIGANSYLLELAGRRVVIDCGMHPKREGDDATPNIRLVPDGELDAIFVSHAHLDHIGSLPVLMRRQPRARVFMSAADRLTSARPCCTTRSTSCPARRADDTRTNGHHVHPPTPLHPPRGRPVRAGLAGVRHPPALEPRRRAPRPRH